MACDKCGSERVASITAKCSDCCGVNVADKEHDGYVPDDMGIGGGDYIELSWCLDCGKIQGDFPLDETNLERGEEDD